MFLVNILVSQMLERIYGDIDANCGTVVQVLLLEKVVERVTIVSMHMYHHAHTHILQYQCYIYISS